jgi:hypothetical protein
LAGHSQFDIRMRDDIAVPVRVPVIPALGRHKHHPVPIDDGRSEHGRPGPARLSADCVQLDDWHAEGRMENPTSGQAEDRLVGFTHGLETDVGEDSLHVHEPTISIEPVAAPVGWRRPVRSVRFPFCLQTGHRMASFGGHNGDMTNERNIENREREDLLETLGQHRAFLRQTARGLTDEQAAQRTTVSELCLGGVIKHVALVEQGWADFIREGPVAIGSADESARQSHAAGFRMLDGETLATLLAGYEDVARRTDELVSSLPSLDASHPLPEAPWFEQGARWSARRALLHIVAETAQHAGHADIIRESLDGAKTMG